jgi:hypothetical protein
MTAKYVLRELPGVAEMEARLARIEAHPSPLWAPEADNLGDDVDALVLNLFGLSHVAIFGDENSKPVTEADLTPIKDGFDGAGWDVTDGAGKDLRIMSRIGLTMALVACGLAGQVRDAAAGRALTDTEAQGIEARLSAEVAKFRRGK